MNLGFYTIVQFLLGVFVGTKVCLIITDKIGSELETKIINAKAIDLDNKIFRCNQVLSNVGAKPRGEK